MREKWMTIWQEFSERILAMPTWMQETVLEDIKTAIRNRIAVTEIILKVTDKKTIKRYFGVTST